jgi:hypothetical protein
MTDFERLTSRRNVLKTAGAGLATVTGVSTIGSAEPSFQELLDRAHRIREKTGSQERFLSYLRKHGLSVGNVRTHHKVPAQADGDDVSTQKLVEDDLYTNISLIYEYFQCSRTNTYTEYSWEWDVNSGGGESGDDLVSIGWAKDHYDYDSQESGERVNHYESTDGQNSHAWKYDDSQLGSGDSHWSYVGCNISEHSTNEVRHIGAKYRHTYEETTVTGIYTTFDGGEEPPELHAETGSVDKLWKGGFEQIDETEAETDSTNC